MNLNNNIYETLLGDDDDFNLKSAQTQTAQEVSKDTYVRNPCHQSHKSQQTALPIISDDIEDVVQAYNSLDNTSYSIDLIYQVIDEANTYVNTEGNKLMMQSYDYSYQNLLGLMKKPFTSKLQKIFHEHKMQMRKTVLLYYYRKFVTANELQSNRLLELLLMKKPANHISGINQVTILTSPTPQGKVFSCKHDCFYCPNEPAHEGNNWTPQPRSYLSKEPAVQRANRNKFDPYLQTKSRMDSLIICGHVCDKLEFIIEGGTFTEYPKTYLKSFFQSFIYCVNTYFNDNTSKRPMLSLEEEIEFNKTAQCKVIGICIETRPDAVLENDEDGIPWIQTLLNWGVTRIQLGMQHIDNFILKKVNRGHSIETAQHAIRVLKDNCFKIDVHIMPDLPYSSKEVDMAMFDEIYKTQKYQPDQMKIYPCEVVPWTKIEKWYNQGIYKPYGDDKKEMEDVLHYAMTTCPPWIRLPRVVRDIPETYIQGGMKCGNMRQVVNERIQNTQGEYSDDIRFREIGRHPTYSVKDARLYIRKYDTTGGTEYFISYETYDKVAIYGFTRLRISHHHHMRKKDTTHESNDDNNDDNNDEEHVVYSSTLKNKGLIRELHVYGNVEAVRLNDNESDSDDNGAHIKNGKSTQHAGFGKKLMYVAEQLASLHGMNGTAVISGIGVRKYYEKIDYVLKDTYMVKTFGFWRWLSNALVAIYIYWIHVESHELT